MVIVELENGKTIKLSTKRLQKIVNGIKGKGR